LKPRIATQDAFGFANSERKKALDYLDIGFITKIRAVMEMIQVGAKRLEQRVLWPVLHVTREMIPLFSSRECDLNHTASKSGQNHNIPKNPEGRLGGCGYGITQRARKHAPDFEHVYSITKIPALIRVP